MYLHLCWHCLTSHECAMYLPLCWSCLLCISCAYAFVLALPHPLWICCASLHLSLCWQWLTSLRMRCLWRPFCVKAVKASWKMPSDFFLREGILKNAVCNRNYFNQNYLRPFCVKASWRMPRFTFDFITCNLSTMVLLLVWFAWGKEQSTRDFTVCDFLTVILLLLFLCDRRGCPLLISQCIICNLESLLCVVCLRVGAVHFKFHSLSFATLIPFSVWSAWRRILLTADVAVNGWLSLQNGMEKQSSGYLTACDSIRINGYTIVLQWFCSVRSMVQSFWKYDRGDIASRLRDYDVDGDP